MALVAPQTEKYTYGDYLTWLDGKRWEIIKGVPYQMTPGPLMRHQLVLGELYLQLAGFLRGRTCRVILSPFDVRLPRGDEADSHIDTVVQPDLVIVCDRSKLDERGCRRAPDLVVEILSPSTADRDQGVKLDLYEQHGVKEYWIIDPIDREVTVHLMGEEGKYGPPVTYEGEVDLEVAIIPGLVIDLGRVF
ncbi:MAG: Uma2 family endonuclease, partial [Deltaproteobacteria bacterium]|nr:Uma2 family endonuclease [Deltaproteobacteria bacterium]